MIDALGAPRKSRSRLESFEVEAQSAEPNWISYMWFCFQVASFPDSSTLECDIELVHAIYIRILEEPGNEASFQGHSFVLASFSAPHPVFINS